MRPSDQSEFASTGDRIGAIVHPSFWCMRARRVLTGVAFVR